MHLFIAHALLRKEEKLFAETAAKAGIPMTLLDVRERPLHQLPFAPGDVVLARCVSHSLNIALARFAESRGVRVVNPSRVMELCNDKGATSCRLAEANIPQPEFRMAFSGEAALASAEELGFPVVFKPVTGSWGRLLAKANDRDAAEAIIEHKEHLGGQHHVFYLQRFVEKKGADIRAFVLNGEPVSAFWRKSDHWITNTARGGQPERFPLNDELSALLRKTASVIGGDYLAIDLFATDDGYLVNEVNDTAEFRNSIDVVGVDIPAIVIQHCMNLMEGANAA